ncbi:Keratin type II cytoskeletal 75 [Pseudomonas aeruginosa]|nr:Keratin type II cytoskeletal 75 [Pseudomonas aeruginosa]
MVGQDVVRCLVALGLALQGLSFGVQAAPGGAVELYRYVNDKGVVVLDRQGVPPQYIGKGYQVLNDQGRVIRTVPPAPTAEELRQRKAAQAQASSDAQLLRLYSSVEDVDRARERRWPNWMD